MMDLLLALRGIRRHPGFAALVIGTLAIGIGANTTMYSLVRAVFFRPLPFPESDRLVLIGKETRFNRRQMVFNVQGFVQDRMVFHGDIIGVPLKRDEV